MTRYVFLMVTAGAAAGLGLGMVLARFAEALFYHVRATDGAMLAFPVAVLIATTLLATIARVMRAVRIDPAELLRVE